MQLSNTEWSELILERAATQDLANFEIDIGLKNVYWAMDGVRTLSDIATDGQYELQDLVDLARQLVQLGLVVVAHDNGATIDQAFFDFLSDLLDRELGPMGEIILDDTVRSLGSETTHFPGNRLPKLIECLSREMGDANKANIFKDRVAAQIKRMKPES